MENVFLLNTRSKQVIFIVQLLANLLFIQKQIQNRIQISCITFIIENKLTRNLIKL